MAREETYENAGFQLPDGFMFDSDGHWVDVINNYDRNKVRLHFMTPKNRKVTVSLSLKEVKELRRELKAADVLVSIAEDY